MIKKSELRSHSMDDKDENTRLVKAQGLRIFSPEELLEFLEIDLNEWEILRQKAGTWDAFRKDIQKDLTFKAGKADGYVIDMGKINTEVLFRTEVILVRKNPIPLLPEIRPVVIKSRLRKKQASTSSAANRDLIIPDLQFGFKKDLNSGILTPYHDREAISIVLQVLKKHRFKRIFILGDAIDLPEASTKFITSPEFYFTVAPSIMELGWLLSQIRRLAPEAEIYLFEGNHEKRLKDAISSRMPFVYGLKTYRDNLKFPVLSVPHLLSLESLEIRWIGGYPDSYFWATPLLKISHGVVVKAKAGATAAAVVERASACEIFGHIHRIEYAARTITGHDGRYNIFAASPGCLCKTDGRVPGNSLTQNWQNGFSVVDYVGDMPFITLIEINNGSAIFEGTLFQGVDNTKDIQEDLGSDFRFMA